MKSTKKHQILPGNPRKMGATICHGGINFAIEVPAGCEASLLLYKKNQKEVMEEIPITQDMCMGEVGFLFVSQLDATNLEYAYRMDGQIVMDPYAKVIKEKRCGFLDFPKAAVQERDTFIPYEETILYKLHVKGFTMQAKVKKKGTFAGVQERIPYLQELGVNAVEIMPMYEWDENLRPTETSSRYGYVCPDGENVLKNYWGYAKKNYYFAPKASFASSADAPSECKSMIDALHQAGMECIMEIYFPEGTQATVAIDVLCFWKLVYQVDGFHLMGQGVPVDAIAHHPLLKKSKLLIERVDDDWLYGQDVPAYRNMAEYNDDFMNCGRRFLKGDDSQVEPFVYLSRKNPACHGVINYMANVDGFTLMDMVSYDRKHNEENGEDNQDGRPANDVWNCGAEGPSKKHSVRNLRKKQLKNAILYVMLAQGTPLIYQGDECGNTQNGNNNAYAMDNGTGWVTWKNTQMEKELLSFTKQAIAFRKNHPVLHMEKAARMMDYRSLGFPDLSYHDERAWYSEFQSSSRGVGCMYCGAYAKNDKGMEDDFIYVAYNAYWEPHEFALPTLPKGIEWAIVIRTDKDSASCFEEEAPSINQRNIMVPERTVMVLIGKKTGNKEQK